MPVAAESRASLRRQILYLFHFQVIMICKHLPGTEHSIAGSLLTLAAAMAVAAAVMAVREMIRRRRPHYSK